MAMAAASSILRRASSQLIRIPISSSSSIESYLLPPHKNSPCLPEFPEEDPSMDLMAVPKKKTSKYKKRLRNGPKALKPIPVIVKCNWLLFDFKNYKGNVQ